MTDEQRARLDAALAECGRTFRGPPPCFRPEYLAARRAYHAALVEAGLADGPYDSSREPTAMRKYRNGDAVRITYEGHTVEGSVALASDNGLSLILQFEALLNGYAGSMPVLSEDDGGHYHDLIRHDPVGLELLR